MKEPADPDARRELMERVEDQEKGAGPEATGRVAPRRSVNATSAAHQPVRSGRFASATHPAIMPAHATMRARLARK
jgi:hypothetical protein